MEGRHLVAAHAVKQLADGVLGGGGLRCQECILLPQRRRLALQSCHRFLYIALTMEFFYAPHKFRVCVCLCICVLYSMLAQRLRLLHRTAAVVNSRVPHCSMPPAIRMGTPSDSLDTCCCVLAVSIRCTCRVAICGVEQSRMSPCCAHTSLDTHLQSSSFLARLEQLIRARRAGRQLQRQTRGALVCRHRRALGRQAAVQRPDMRREPQARVWAAWWLLHRTRQR